MCRKRYFGRHVLTCLVAWLAIASSTAFSATLYVAKNGSDTNSGSKSAPFLTIQAAINASKKNGRIVVGPGQYDENLQINVNSFGDPLIGLKLESSAGRWATIIHGDASTNVVYSAQPKVQIGKRGKGFTIQNSANNASGLLYIATSPGGKIEGNRFFQNHKGVFVSNSGNGRSLQIRHNIFSRNANYGLDCAGCVKAMIKDNHSDGNLYGIVVSDSASSTLMKNVVTNNTQYGVYNDSPLGKNMIRDNVMTNSQFNGYIQLNGEGDTAQGNIAAQNGTGYSISMDFHVHPQQTKHNLSVANAVDGFFAGIGNDQKFEFNTGVSNGDDTVQVSGATTFASFKGNNAMESGCGIFVDSGTSVKHVKQFFANNTASDTCGFGFIDLDSTTANRPNTTRTNAASKL